MRIIPRRHETVPIDSLIPHPRNPRDGRVDVIKESIDRNGFYSEVLVQESTGFVIGGNHRIRAAREAGGDQVPVTYLDVTDEEALRILLADNRTSDLAKNDDEKLAAALGELQGLDDGLLGTGFTDHDLAAMLGTLGGGGARPEPRIGEAEKLREKWGTEQGQVWTAGPHRVLCGDSTDPASFDLLMQGERAEVLWTDPPYGVNYTGKTKDAMKIQNDGADGIPELLAAAFGALDPYLASSARFYIACPAGPAGTSFRLAVVDAGWKFHQALVWLKDTIVLGHSDYHYKHEDVLYGYKPGDGRPGRGKHAGTRWYGDHSQASVLEFARPRRSAEHPTMKPVELIEHCFANSAKTGDIVLDPFAGSGSTLIAAHVRGLQGRGIELDPAYFAVILQRLEDAGLAVEQAA